ncbi:hypothetical protein ACFQ36_02830 [Arthrobacter sp. GCM10027362]|uniref:hypothetical protein n=1 Tax=Arthrobacter sp. GCM10027362 TaxID=3273379 RepID=UPI00362AAE2A
MSEIDIHRLLECASLETVTFLEISAKRAHQDMHHSEFTSRGEYDVAPEYTLMLGRHDSEDLFSVRLKTEIVTDPGRVFVDAVAEYSLSEIKTSQVSEELLLEFANNVSIMTLLPYIRHAIADMSQRVFLNVLTMPIYRRGDITFSPADAAKSE